MSFSGKINKRRSSSVVLAGTLLGSAICDAASQSVAAAGSDLANAMQETLNNPGFFRKYGVVLKTVFGVILAVAAVGILALLLFVAKKVAARIIARKLGVYKEEEESITEKNLKRIRKCQKGSRRVQKEK